MKWKWNEMIRFLKKLLSQPSFKIWPDSDTMLGTTVYPTEIVSLVLLKPKVNRDIYLLNVKWRLSCNGMCQSRALQKIGNEIGWSDQMSRNAYCFDRNSLQTNTTFCKIIEGFVFNFKWEQLPTISQTFKLAQRERHFVKFQFFNRYLDESFWPKPVNKLIRSSHKVMTM